MKKQFFFGLVGVAAFLIVTNNALAATTPPISGELSKYYKGTVQSIGRDSIVINTKDTRIIEQTETVLDDEEKAGDVTKKITKKNKESKQNQSAKAKKLKVKDRIAELMREKKKEVADKAAQRAARKQKATQAVVVTVKANPAQIAEHNLSVGSKILIEGSYSPTSQTLYAKTIVDAAGKSIKKSR